MKEELDAIKEDYIIKFSKLETEVHTLTTTVGRLFKKFDDYVDKTQPKPLSFPMIISGFLAFLTIFGLLFGSVIYIANSSNAPLAAQLNETTRTLNRINSSTLQNNNFIQLTNKEVSSLKTATENNAETLQWALFIENLPKQLTEARKDIEFIKIRLNERK